jgi:transcriptional regulator with GAF, ATPase, and Fis domain
LNVFPISLPPLRDRIEDIPLIAQHFVNLFSRKIGKNIITIPAHVMAAMQDYNWPGNVRELANIIERAVISTSGSKLQLAEELKQHNEMETEELKSFHDMERDYIIKVLEKTDWKISGENSAAEILRLDRSTLRNKMKKLESFSGYHWVFISSLTRSSPSAPMKNSASLFLLSGAVSTSNTKSNASEPR